mmetsp:Transcript_9546/g.14192  ORF Transcript_9546/g.14192 Transcript_9546/m.14192 type:complete len:214 (+) Transcript_9546:610-1251(+)
MTTKTQQHERDNAGQESKSYPLNNPSREKNRNQLSATVRTKRRRTNCTVWVVGAQSSVKNLYSHYHQSRHRQSTTARQDHANVRMRPNTTCSKIHKRRAELHPAFPYIDPRKPGVRHHPIGKHIKMCFFVVVHRCSYQRSIQIVQMVSSEISTASYQDASSPASDPAVLVIRMVLDDNIAQRHPDYPGDYYFQQYLHANSPMMMTQQQFYRRS